MKLQLPPPANPTTVLVFGAGMAGLVSALELKDAGYEVILIEARDVPGGRVQTVRNCFTQGLHAEAGALFLAGNHDLTIGYSKALNVNLTLFDLSKATLLYLKGQSLRSPDPSGKPVVLPYPLTPLEQKLGPDGMDQYYGAVVSGVQTTISADWPPSWAPPLEIPYTDRLRAQGASPGAVEFLSVGFSALIGEGPGSFSAMMLMFDAMFTNNHAIGNQAVGGNDALPKAFANLLGNRISYQTVIQSIAQDANSVTATVDYHGAQSQVRGDYAVCTLPLGVLRNIPVTPAFSPTKQHAIRSLRYTSTTRVFLEFSREFWLDDNLNGLVVTDLPIGLVYPQPNQPGPAGVLNVIMAGQFARDMAKRSESERLRFTLAEIAKFWPKAPALYVGGGSKVWDADPYSLGSYPWYAPGEMSALLPGLAQREGRIYFAGDYVSTLPGWIEGALASGQKAAEAIASNAAGLPRKVKLFGVTEK